MERTLLLKTFFFGFFLFLFSTGLAQAQSCVSGSDISWTDETCPGENDGMATITITGGEPNFVYELQKRTGIASYTSIEFSPEVPDRFYTFNGIAPGSYRILIYDSQINDCVPVGSDPFIIGTTGTTPAPIAISGNATVCEEQPGVMYEVPLTAGSSYSWTVPAGASIVSGATGPENNRIFVNFGTSSGEITVVETNTGGCSGDPATLAVNVVAKPAVFTLSANGATIICENEEGPELILSGSETGVDYVLVRNTDTSVGTFAGTGNPLSFGTHNVAGDYRVLAMKSDLTGCNQLMDGMVTITVDSIPDKPTLAGEIASVCVGADAPVVSLNGENIRVYSDVALANQVGSGNTFDPDTDPAFSTAQPDTITYYATQQVGACTSDALVFDVVIIANPDAAFAQNSLEVCQNESAQLEVNLTGAAPFDLTYEVNGQATTATGITANPYLISFDSLQADVRVVLTHVADATNCEQVLSDTATITVNPLPMVSLAFADDESCIDETAFELTGGNPTGGEYAGPGVVFNATEGYYEFSPLAAGVGSHLINYTVTNSTTGCSNTTQDTLHVFDLPAVSLTLSPDTVCENDAQYVLSGGLPEGGTYSGPGVDSNTSVFDPSAAGVGDHIITYSYTNDTTGCSNTAQDTITINPKLAPELTLSVSDTEVCAGDSVTFTASVTNEGTEPTYNWYLNNVLVVDNNQNTYTFAPADADQVYLEFIQGTLACGTGDTIVSATQAFVVHPLPAATLAEDATICTGGSADLTFTFSGTAPFTVEYTNGSQTFIETSADTSLIVSVSPDTTTTYTVVNIADNYCSQVVSGQAVTITVNEAVAPAVEITPATASICEGEELTFTANSTNAGTSPTYQWYVNNLAVSGNNQATYAYVPQDGDSVYVQLTQGALECGTGETVTSNVAGVSVEPTPDASFSGPATVCLAEVPVSYTSATAGGIFTANIAGVISEAGEFSPTEAGPYTIYYSISSVAGCSATDSMSVQVNPVDSVSVDLAVNQPEACGETNEFVFTANITNGGDNPQIRWFVNKVEQVGETATTFTATNLTAAAHEVKVAVTQDAASMTCGNGATVMDSLSVRVYPTPVATLSTNDETTICAGDTVDLLFNFQGTAPFELAYTNGTDTTFVSGITADSLLVSVQPTDNQAYNIVSFADASACTATFSGEVAITVNTVPQGAPTNLQATTIACSEISVGWDAITNSQGYQIRWSEDSTFASGVERDTTIATTATLSGLSGGATYYIEVTAFNACGAATESSVTSISLPAISAAPENISISAESCDGFTVDWNSVAGAQSYELDLATDTAFTNFVAGYNPFSTTDTIEVLSGLDPLNYYLRLRTVDSCGISQNSGVIQIDLNRFVIDSLTAEITHVSCAGDSTGSIAVSVHGGVGPFSYLWSTGDTTNLIESKPVGSYWVEVNSTSGCSLRDTFEIREPLPILLEMAKEDVSCYGDSTGTASVSIQGGVEPYSISWSNGVMDTTHIYNLPAGQYFVEITDANSCVARDTVTILQPDSLQLSADVVHVNCPSDSTGSINLSVSGGTGAYRYVWHTLEVAEDQFMVENLPAGSYPVTVYDSLNCSISDTLQINSTNPAVVVDLGPDKCAVESIELDAGYNVADYAIAWSTGDTTQTITVTESGSYSVTVTNRTTTCAGNDAVDIRIGEPLPASVQINLQEEESCSGDEYIVVASTENAGPNPVYQWYLNADSVGVNSDTLRLFSYAAGDTIRVVVAPDTTSGCATAEEVSDSHIISLPWMEAPVIEAEQLTVCSEETPEVTVAGDSIRWYLNEVNEAAFLNGGESPVYSAAGPDTVYLLATQQVASCRQSLADTLELIILTPVAQPIMPEDITRCGEEELPVVVAEGENIRWYADAALTQFINEGDTLALTGLNSSAAFSTDTVFYATQSINGCTSMADSITITTYPMPVVDLGEDIVRCSPAEVILDAGYNPADGYTIEWVPSGATTQTDTVTSTGDYAVTVTHNASGCFATDTVRVTIEESITSTVEISPLNAVSCGTDSLMLAASVTNPGENPTYSWYLNDTLQQEATGEIFTLTNYAEGDSISVTVNVDLECATENQVSNYFIIDMPVLAIPSLSVSADTICEGEANPVFTASDVIEGAYLRWYKGAVHIDSLMAEGTDSTFTPQVSAAGTYTYYVTQSTDRCDTSKTASGSFTISEAVSPEVSMTHSAGTEGICEGAEIKFTASATNAGEKPVFVWFVKRAGFEVQEVQRGLSNTYNYESAAADDQVWVRVEVASAGDLCLSSMEDTADAYAVVLKSAEDCSNDGGGGGGVDNCTVFAVELSEKIEPSCDRNNGYLQYSVTGGVSPYTISYSFVETSITEVLSGDTISIDIDQIPANEYVTLSIVDAQGNACSLDSLSLTMAPRITATLTKEEGGDVSCFGEQMGKAKLEIMGGNAPFDYKLNDGAWIETSSRTVYFDTLSAGVSSVLVRSVNDRDFVGDACYGEAEVEIQSLNPKLAITDFETEDANCNDNTGKIWIREVVGGNGGPYKIKLQSEDSFREFNPEVAFEGLPRGEYRVVLSDGVCEIVSSPIQVGSPGLIALEETSGVIPFSCETPELRSGLYLEIDSDLTRVQGPFEADISILKADNTYEQLFNALTFNGSGILRVNGLERGAYRVEVRSVTGEGCPENREFIIGGSEIPVPITFEAIGQNIYCADDRGGVVIKDLSGADATNFKVTVYAESGEVALEHNISSIRYASQRDETLTGLPAGIYQMVITQDQKICDRLETSEPVIFEIEEKAQMLQAEVVGKTESFPERGSGSLTLAIQTNSGQEPYVSSIALIKPLYPGQYYESVGDTVKYDPIEATFGFTYTDLPAGDYELYVTDANGCGVILQETIAHDERLFIPNLFTPNNDGYNDVFYVRNIPEKGTRLIITNRWGKVVYQTQDYANDWDGEELPEGIYFYHLQVVGGEGLDMKGWIELRRGSRP